MILRIRYERQGGHVHVRVFSGQGPYTLGKCGDLVFTEAEWPEIRRGLARMGGLTLSVQLIPEGVNVP
jgi:hypothetical protein